ncbi:multicopper oxidase family protein [Halorubrum sp. ASP1]|jgi:FtsP/CotA-like multicopper oxidase with cupredoxin domain|uniref:multicopper oxidase family protein n=1 Tax=Halobacteriales TaxID=2235 RepID=UPI000E22D792|nr:MULTISPECIES: multicopper oxidase family protein [Haloferacales]RDZ32090.1 copper oxidase [Haloferax sp. Atlit-24N]RLM33242.1 multicopper oxidase family protein [Haloferax sp. Atlit-109R]RLM40618.1 multicopper oxidase family protein [Haloferax sp. Atlit-105R]RLM62851.1 multicopper oxidase family protein [Halorubrum sp. Atlit-9R]TKX60468.1 multicopper oxidase family protein [Halorubrum sp. ASP1]
MTSSGLSRRKILQLSGISTLGALAGCASPLPGTDDGGGRAVTPRPTVTADPDTSVSLTATSGTIRPASDTSTTTWLYDGQYPGPELRVQEGDVLSVELANDLQEETTIHWHGIPVANPVDGVPNVTQEPVASGDTFTYKFRAEPAGTYFYHSHVGLQLDRGLLGPLIVEERDPHVEYDREYVVVLDDYLSREPRLPSDGGMGGGGMGGMMGDVRPPYEGLLINGKLPENPPTFDVTEGDRVRFRFVNASSATVFGVRIAGHEMSVTHADGQPVEPVGADSFVFGAGERYDVVVEATNPGRWFVQANALDGNEPPARAVVEYESTDGSITPQPPSSSSNRLQYGDLRARSSLEGVSGDPDRTFDLTLSRGRNQSYTWTIDGQAYPDADPLQIRPGEHVRIRMTNQSPVVHPMHLHGHFFQVGNAIKDTVIVPGHRGQVTLDFHADNPGRWLFHCHNLYHLDAGMARVVEYVE